MKKSILFSVVPLILGAPISQAQITEKELSWTSAPEKPAAKSSALHNQKKAEFEKKWSECSTLAAANSKKHQAIKGWILISWLRCSREASNEKKSPEALINALKSLDANPNLLLSGPWRNALSTEAVRSRLSLIDQVLKTNPELAWKHTEILIDQKDRLDKPQRARVFQAAGEMAQAKSQFKAAQFLYEQSLAEQESKSTRDKLNSVLLALNEAKPAEKEKLETVKPNEGNFEERFQASIKSNDLLTLLEDSIQYLEKYPGGLRSKWAQEKVLEVYFGMSDSSRDEKMKNLRERALSAMEKAEASRVMEWGRALHRRSDYSGCLRLTEKALETLSTSTSGSTLYYLAGRCAQLSGQYDKARKHFEIYIDKFAGGEDLVEVHFRLGLVHLRLKQASSAIAVFEKLLQLKGADRYELNARYWLARSLQATNNTRALAVMDEIRLKYPLSYYGLRLKMESAGGLLEWPTNLKLAQEPKGTYHLTSAQKKTLERAELLAKNNWIAEALAEVGDLPLPFDAQMKVLLARQFNQWQLFPPVVRLVNEAGDLNSELRSLDVIRLALPQVYQNAINDQAQKQKLSPYLVRSLIRQESAFGPRAISTSNAYGLMQLIGPTAQEVASELGLRGLVIPDDVFVPENNIQMGTYYIAKMIRLFGGNVPLGLAAYNAGPHRMQNFVEARKEVSDQVQKFSSDPWDEMWFDELPWYETSFYVKAILRNSILYQLSEKAESKEPDQRRVQFGSVLWANLVLKP